MHFLNGDYGSKWAFLLIRSFFYTADAFIFMYLSAKSSFLIALFATLGIDINDLSKGVVMKKCLVITLFFCMSSGLYADIFDDIGSVVKKTTKAVGGVAEKSVQTVEEKVVKP